MNGISHFPKYTVSPANTSSRPPRLLELLHEPIRYKHFSLRTGQAYVHWVRTFIRQHRMQHSSDMNATKVEQFLCWLANERNVAPSTHNQALSVLLFLYREVLAIDLRWMKEIGWARRSIADRRAATHLQQRRETRSQAQIFHRKGRRGSGW